MSTDEKQQVVEYGYKEDSGYGALCAKTSPLFLALRICKKYSLDPDLNELKMIKTQLGLVPYITASGLRRITTPFVKSLKTTCVDIDKENKIPSWVVYRAEVETIDGRFFSGEGAFDESEVVGKTKRTLHLMRTRAETRAVSRALRFLVKGLDIYDELPDEVKQDEVPLNKEELVKELEKHPNAIPTEPIHQDKLSEDLLDKDLEVKEPPVSIKLDTILAEAEPSKPKKEHSELEELLSLSLEDIDNAPTGFEGIDFLVPYLEDLKEKNANATPDIAKLLNHIRKRTPIAKYIWTWFVELKKNNLLDQNATENFSKRTSVPILLYEQFSKRLFQLDAMKSRGANTKWYQLAKEDDQNMLFAYIFYFLYSMYYHHIKEKASEYPDMQLIGKLYIAVETQKWIASVFKIQDNLELPEGVEI